MNWKQVAGCWTPYYESCFELKRNVTRKRPKHQHTLMFRSVYLLQFLQQQTQRMGSAIGIVRGTESRNKIFTQLRQENVRLLARIERLSAEASRLKAEINAVLKDKELLTCSINGGHIHRFSPTNGEKL